MAPALGFSFDLGLRYRFQSPHKLVVNRDVIEVDLVQNWVNDEESKLVRTLGNAVESDITEMVNSVVLGTFFLI